MAKKTVKNLDIYASLFSQELKKADQKRLRILSEAMKVLGTHGLDGTNYETVGKASGMLRAHVAYYFKSRDDLLEGVFRLMTEMAQIETIAKLKESKSPIDQIRAIVRGAFACAEKFPFHTSVVIQLMSLASYRSRFMKIHRAIRESGADRLAVILAETPLKAGYTPDLAATLIQASIFGHLTLFATTGAMLPLRKFEALCMEQVESVFAAQPES